MRSLQGPQVRWETKENPDFVDPHRETGYVLNPAPAYIYIHRQRDIHRYIWCVYIYTRTNIARTQADRERERDRVTICRLPTPERHHALDGVSPRSCPISARPKTTPRSHACRAFMPTTSLLTTVTAANSRQHHNKITAFCFFSSLVYYL